MIFSLLRVVGIAVAGHGGRILSAGLPFGPILFDIAKEAFHDWRRSKKEKECIAEIEAVAQAAQEEIRRQSAEVAREEGRELTDDSKLALSLYLSMIPASIKQSLRRPSDPTGTTIPRDRGMSNTQDLVRLLPNQLPRFKPGDRPLPGVDWELVELLGVGGFGEVWKAKHPDFDGVPPVALKFCLDEDARDRLLRHEAAILNQVMRQGAHPGIVTLQHTYLRADPPCLEYELIEGGSLVSLITHEQGSPNRALELIAALARTLAFTHRQNPPVVHLDLKPANILIANENGQSVLKIADFGIGAVAARQALDEATRQPTTQSLFMTNVVRGAYTPLYASPQQQRGDRHRLVDGRLDVSELAGTVPRDFRIRYAARRCGHGE